MLEDLHLLDDGQVVVVGRHAQHQAVLNIQGDLPDISELPDQGVQGVTVGHPTNEPCEQSHPESISSPAWPNSPFDCVLSPGQADIVFCRARRAERAVARWVVWLAGK